MDLAASPRSRLLSGLEFLAAAAIVVGHNVFHVLPNEVPILFVAGLVSVRLRNRDWRAIGFRRPSSWAWMLGLAVAAAAARLLLGQYVIDPLTAHFWPPANAPAMADEITGDPVAALTALALVWTFAAVGEEVGYRGYLTMRAGELLGGSRAAWWGATIVVSALFGIGHWYKGPAGVVDSGIAGLILGAVYLLSGRCLWTCVLAHGLIDTTSIALLYLGLAS